MGTGLDLSPKTKEPPRGLQVQLPSQGTTLCTIRQGVKTGPTGLISCGRRVHSSSNLLTNVTLANTGFDAANSMELPRKHISLRCSRDCTQGPAASGPSTYLQAGSEPQTHTRRNLHARANSCQSAGCQKRQLKQMTRLTQDQRAGAAACV